MSVTQSAVAPGTALRSLGITQELERLQSLDDVWTSYTSQANLPESIEHDYDHIVRLVAEMLYLLTKLREGLLTIRAELNQLSDADVDEALDRLLADGPINSGEARDILEPVLTDYSLRGALITSCDYAVQVAPIAINELVEKLGLIQRRELQTGDLPKALKCAGYLALVGAGVVTAVAATGGTVVVIAGVTQSVMGGLFGFRTSGCRETWEDITREVRT